MDTIKLWARNGDAVRQAIELGELVHLETASEELTDEFLLFAIQSGLLAQWANAFPDPRGDPEISMEVILASHVAALGPGPFAVRSSGRDEDGAAHSHAGQFLSLLEIPAGGIEDAALQDCRDPIADRTRHEDARRAGPTSRTSASPATATSSPRGAPPARTPSSST